MYFFQPTVFIIGLVFGSFINCLIWRVHENETMLNRSYCPKCRHQIAWYDNLPVLSFLFLGGKCRHCGQAISWQYPLVELMTAILFLLSYNIQYSISNTQSIINNQYSINDLVWLFRNWFVICVMVIIFIYDLRWYLILDRVSLPAVLIVVLLNFYLGFDLMNMAISGIIGGSFFLFQFVISRGKWIGGGDIRLGLLMGVILGWPKILLAIMLAYLIGSVVGITLLVAKKKQWGSELPLGVFLTPATLITMFWGEKIINWYLNLVGF
jgi:prepilin signal peptidase PulO-like enzyme (type II secretory pathway)